jgi:hypothetical protein
MQYAVPLDETTVGVTSAEENVKPSDWRSASVDVYVLLAVNHDSSAVAMFLSADSACEVQPFFLWFRKTGMAIAARIAMIRMTTRSSIRVKPPSRSSRAAWNFWNIRFLLPFCPYKPNPGTI